MIIDTAPVESVSDTFALTRFADATLYVCRANHTSKNCVFNAVDFATEGSLKNVVFVLNDSSCPCKFIVWDEGFLLYKKLSYFA